MLVLVLLPSRTCEGRDVLPFGKGEGESTGDEAGECVGEC